MTVQSQLEVDDGERQFDPRPPPATAAKNDDYDAITRLQSLVDRGFVEI